MPIQAAIVAGGRGVRMRPATDDLPKPMLSVAGKPLLEHQLEWLKSQGVRDIFMCLGYKAEAVSKHFGDGTRWGMNIAYQVEAVPRGTAGAVRDLGSRVKGDLLVVYGDIFIALDGRRLLDFHAGHTAAGTVVIRATDHPLDSDLVRLSGDSITAFYRARAGEPYENWACAALFVVRQPLLELVPADAPSDFGRDIFPRALAAGLPLKAYRTDEEVADLGTPERLKAFLDRREAKR